MPNNQEKPSENLNFEDQTVSVISNFIKTLNQDFSQEKNQSLAVRVLDCIRYIKLNYPLIEWQLNNLTSQNDTMTAHNGMPFHIGSYKSQGAESYITEHGFAFYEIEQGIIKLTLMEKSQPAEYVKQVTEFINSFGDSGAGCMEARLQGPIEFIGNLFENKVPLWSIVENMVKIYEHLLSVDIGTLILFCVYHFNTLIGTTVIQEKKDNEAMGEEIELSWDHIKVYFRELYILDHDLDVQPSFFSSSALIEKKEEDDCYQFNCPTRQAAEECLRWIQFCLPNELYFESKKIKIDKQSYHDNDYYQFSVTTAQLQATKIAIEELNAVKDFHNTIVRLKDCIITIAQNKPDNNVMEYNGVNVIKEIFEQYPVLKVFPIDQVGSFIYFVLDCMGEGINNINTALEMIASIGYSLTPLQTACIRGEEATVKQLCEQQPGTGINATTMEGSTALHFACFCEQTGCMETLIRHRADTTLRNIQDKYAYQVKKEHHLCYRDNIFSAVQKQLVYAVNNNQQTIIERKINENTGWVTVPIYHTNPNRFLTRDVKGHRWTMLYTAAWCGGPDMMKYILEKIADNENKSITEILNQQREHGFTLLAIACVAHNTPQIKSLVEQGADTRVCSINSLTPLHCLLKNLSQEDDCEDAIKALVDGGVDVDAQTSEGGLTAVHIAVYYKNRRALKTLIKYGADLTKKDGYHERADQIKPLAINILLERQCDLLVTLINGNFYTLQCVIDKNLSWLSVQFVDYVSITERDNAKTSWTLLYLAACLDINTTNIMQWILEKLGEKENKLLKNILHERRENGQTVLGMAARQGTLSTVKYLVEQGADINQVSEDGWSPLHYSIVSPKPREGIAHYLLSKRANPNIRTCTGDMSLHSAVELMKCDEVSALVTHGADLCSTNAAGETPYQVAVKKLNDYVRERDIEATQQASMRDSRVASMFSKIAGFGYPAKEKLAAATSLQKALQHTAGGQALEKCSTVLGILHKYKGPLSQGRLGMIKQCLFSTDPHALAHKR